MSDVKIPDKPYFRIGEVSDLVGVEPHVLRYWEREFRTIRPQKSARGQRVYTHRDVETLIRVRQLLYRDGFTIAGARRMLQKARGAADGVEPAVEPVVAAATAPEPTRREPARSEPSREESAQPKRPRPGAATLPLFEPTRAPEPAPRGRDNGGGESAAHAAARDGSLHRVLRELRGEIEHFLADL